MSNWTVEYIRHSALNLGQVAQGVRYLVTHPDYDRIAPPGTIKHVLRAVPLRLKRIANDLLFAVLPPRWHHTRDELKIFRRGSVKTWYQAGFGPHRFTEAGDLLPEPAIVHEARWDPRCREY